jgi:hypothetical protein
VHQQFVNSAIDDAVRIGNRYCGAFDLNNLNSAFQQDASAFKAILDTLAMFLTDYKKSVHEKCDDESSPTSMESMDVETEKKVIIARCTQSSGTKDVCPIYPCKLM